MNGGKKDNFWTEIGIYGSVGIQLAIAVVGGWFLGDYFDHRWNTTPWLAISGLAAGFTGGLYNLTRVLGWYQKRKTKKKNLT